MSRVARRDERGATLLLFALCMILLLTLVAFAVDLGQGRFSSRDNQQAADLASLSAGYFLAGNGVSPAVGQPQAACAAALSSLSTNLEGFSLTPGQITSACASFPASAPSPCTVTNMVSTSPSPLVQGEYRIHVQWPITAAQIADSRFSGAGTNDGTNDCERMRIRVEKTEGTAFAGVIGVDTVSSNGESVIRGGPARDKLGIAALLLLEREGCRTLYASGQGSVIVQTVQDPDTGEHRPGVIQSDSAGSTTAVSNALTCTTNSNQFGQTIYAACPGNSKIIAQNAPDGTAGVIGSHSLQVGGRGASCYSDTAPTGLSVEPGPSGITSRKPADDRYNPQGRRALSDLHEAGFLATVTNATATSGTIKSTNADCSPANNTVFGETGTITFNCGTSGFSVGQNRTVTIPNATTVKFIGGMSVSGSLEVGSATTVVVARSSAAGNGRLVVTNNGTVSFSNARTVYVGGTPVSCTNQNNCGAVDVSGVLRVNTGAVSTATCANGPGATPPGTAMNWTQLATFGGKIDVSGTATLCQTMLYAGRSQSTHSEDQRVIGSINCSSDKPCPAVTTDQSRDFVQFMGSVTWTAPNQTTTEPNGDNPFEGLALWTEATGDNRIKGSGTVVTSGVFFLPNAMFEFNGQAAANNPFNAQFFARTLQFSGDSDLNLAPNPRDSVQTAVAGTYGLIR